MEKKDHIDYWVQQSLDDWEAVFALFHGGKKLQSLFLKFIDFAMILLPPI
jgi:hypothetical protein